MCRSLYLFSLYRFFPLFLLFKFPFNCVLKLPISPFWWSPSFFSYTGFYELCLQVQGRSSCLKLHCNYTPLPPTHSFPSCRLLSTWGVETKWNIHCFEMDKCVKDWMKRDLLLSPLKERTGFPKTSIKSSRQPPRRSSWSCTSKVSPLSLRSLVFRWFPWSTLKWSWLKLLMYHSVFCVFQFLSVDN